TLYYVSAIIEIMKDSAQITKYADMFSAIGAEPRLCIMQLLLSAHPVGMVVNEIQAELGIPNSTLSHHLDKLRNEALINIRREINRIRVGWLGSRPGDSRRRQWLWRTSCERSKPPSHSSESV